MKHPFFRACRWLLAALTLVPALLLIFGFLLPAQYGQTFLGEMPAKMDLLKTTPGQRIVLIGGSSIPFGVQSPLLETQLEGYRVVDFGMYADMGTAVMLDWAKQEVHPGDLFVVIPEQHPQTLSCYVGGEDVWQACDGAFGQLLSLSPRRYEALLAAFPGFAGKKLRYFLTQPPVPEGVYARASFNAYGDMACPGRERNILPLGYDPNAQISFDPAALDPEFLEELNRFAREVTAQGGKVLYHFPPMNAAALAPGTDQRAVDAYYDALQEALLFPILGDPNRCLLESGWFFDSNFHLNASGSLVFTQRLAEDLKLYLEDPSPTRISLPAMPAPEFSALAGDDRDADCFLYRRTENGWMAEGLSPQGLAAASLVVPTHYRGEPVVGLSPELFRGNATVTQITLQPNAGTLYDGMFAGCLRLQSVILTGAQPSAYGVGSGLREGADFMIYVPPEALDAYRRSYFWQSYEAWLLPAPQEEE